MPLLRNSNLLRDILLIAKTVVIKTQKNAQLFVIYYRKVIAVSMFIW